MYNIENLNENLCCQEVRRERVKLILLPALLALFLVQPFLQYKITIGEFAF